ncbi:MAG: hypothetical protein VX589_16880 [Myxococcota bacterium]|nr:hypothetical protein [Myxococcota bacterium]
MDKLYGAESMFDRLLVVHLPGVFYAPAIMSLRARAWLGAGGARSNLLTLAVRR